MSDPQLPPPRPVDPTKEYVAGGGLSWSQHGAQVLPRPFDDLTRDLGDDVYERMLVDPQIQANLTVYKAHVLEDGATLHSAVDEKDTDGYALAGELVTWAEAVLDDMEIALDDTLWDMLDAMALGCKVAEEVYAVDTSYTGRSQYVLRALKVKPRRAIGLVVDDYNNLLGLVGAQPGQATPTAIAVGSDSSLLLPRDKFAVLTFRPVDGDPRGRSLLRAAYNPYYLKLQLWPEYYKYLLQFASPSLIGNVAEGAADEQDPDDPEQTITAVQALLRALLEFRNGTALALPYGATVKDIFSSGDGAAFLQAFGLFDRQITTAMLAQTRATMEAENGSRADSETAAGVLSKLIRQTRRSVARMLRRDVLRDLVRYNYGDAAARLTPRVSFGQTDKEDVGALMTAIAALARVDYLDPSQLPGIDQRLNLPPRSPEDMTRRNEQADAPPPPVVAPTPANGTSGTQPPATNEDPTNE